MRAITVGRTVMALTVLGLLPAGSRAQHGGHGGAGLGGHGAAGVVGGHFGPGGITPNGYGGVNIPAYANVGTGIAGPSWVGGYGYPYGTGYGADPFPGMGMSPMDQEMLKQSRLMNIQAQANLATTLAEESRVRMMRAEQKAGKPPRRDRDTPKRKRSSSASATARVSKASERPQPSLGSFVGMSSVRWPVHGFTKPTLAIRAQADKAVLAVSAEVAVRGVARPESVANARSQLARFRSSARSQLPLNSTTLVKLDVFLRGLDEALGASTAEPADSRLLPDR